jgi:D-amino peptidase
MKVYIMTDLEGVAGVLGFHDYGGPEGRYYEVGKELTTLEVSAAVQGCLDAGATEILVVDGHGCGALDQRLLHPAARLLAGRPMGYPFGCDKSFDCALMVGQHAKSNTDGGHISHTGSFTVEEETINGVSVGEMGVNMLFCAYFGVPTVLVSGDVAAAEEARALVPNIEAVGVKEGLKRGSATGLTGDENGKFNGAAIHLHPFKARELIRQHACTACQRRQEIEPFRLEPPYERVLTMRRTETEPAKTGRAKADDLLALLSTGFTWDEG